MWDTVRTSDDPAALGAFIERFPDSSDVDAARARRTPLLRRAAWAGVPGDDRGALRAFVGTWHDGDEVWAARDLLAAAYEADLNALQELVPLARAGDVAAIAEIDALRAEPPAMGWFPIWEFHETTDDGSEYRSKIVVRRMRGESAAAAVDEPPYYNYPRAYRGGPDVKTLFGQGAQLVVEGGPVDLPPTSRGAPTVTLAGDPSLPLLLGVRPGRGLVYLAGKGTARVGDRAWTFDDVPPAACLVAMLRSSIPDERIGAAWTLGRVDVDVALEEAARNTLLDLLSSGERAEMAAAAEALARHPSAAALPRLGQAVEGLKFRKSYLPDIQLEELVQYACKRVLDAHEAEFPTPWPPDGFREDGTLAEAAPVSRIRVPVGTLPLAGVRLTKGSITIEQVGDSWTLKSERPNDGFPVSFSGGSGVSVDSGVPAAIGSEVRFQNRIHFGAVTFDPLPDERLCIKKTSTGWVYLCGGGTVTPDATGVPFELGRHRTVAVCLSLLDSDDALLREGAVRDLGRMPIPPGQRDDAIERIRTCRRGSDDLDLAVEEALKRLGEAPATDE